MSSTITFKARGTNYSLQAPEYSYKVIIYPAIVKQRLSSGNGYGLFDQGSGSDYRVCQAKFLQDATDAQTFRNFLKDSDKGRGIDAELSLGNNSGFFPAGPDNGDSGKFKIRIEDVKSQGVKEEAYLYFNTDITFKIVETPSYSLPSQVNEGNLEIGTIKGLRYPQEWVKPKSVYGYNVARTKYGTNYTIDRSTEADEYDSIFPMECNESKSAALINHLMVSVRANNVTVTGKANHYLFNRENNSAGSYTCQWVNDSIDITHLTVDKFVFDLNFYRLS